ncbi:flagellar filament capping protein FliD [Sporosarcina sp. FSL K6-2383]|uniref:flagellar filament capping protein FliD n=1 Tax=Sporosarcina sp. FSL K6-2383 TaxID=2921556 RepID=UPI003159E6CB
MRIGGLASGIDTDSIIRDLMKANRIPLEKITQKKSYLEMQLDAYRSVNRDLTAASNKVGDTLLLEKSFMAKNITISNPDAVSIKSTSSIADFTGTISIEQLAAQATWQSTGSEATKGKSGNETLSSLGINGTEIIIQAPNAKGVMEDKKVTINPATDTIDSLMTKISKNTDVNAFYDSFSGKFAFTAKNSGAGTINVTGLAGTEFDGTGKAGQNAMFTFNGLQTERSTNSFEINGFEITLKQATGTPAVPGTAVTFSSTPDTDTVANAVIGFVNDYNKMIEELNAKIREPKYRDFPPLTAEQKKEMKENEIKLWEEKALSGTLRNDPTISSMLMKMRQALNDNVIGSDGEKIRLSDLGITTSTNYKDNGKLIIDETKLREMIAENPSKVSELFTKAETGLATTFRKAVDEGQSAIAKLAGSVGAGNDTFTLGNTMKSMNEQIERFEKRMKTVEDRLWKQFTAMEMAINRANAQSAQLQSTLGGV